MNPPILFTAKVDLLKYPSRLKRLKNKEYIVGDLHANALRMINYLTRIGVFEDVPESDYQRLCEIYKQLLKLSEKLSKKVEIVENEFKQIKSSQLRKSPAKKLVEEFCKILNGLKVNTSKKAHLIFLGDMLCDRGANDYLILQVLKKLKTNNVSYEIVFSNHDLDFLINLPFLKKNRVHTSTLAGYKSSSTYGLSSIGLMAILQQNIVNYADFVDNVKTCFVAHLKAIDFYKFINEQGRDSLLLYTHAPFLHHDLTKFYNFLCDKEIEKDSLAKEAMMTFVLNNLNTEFQAMLKDLEGFSAKFLDDRKNGIGPLGRFVWRRLRDFGDKILTSCGYYLYNYHGHDTNETAEKSVNKKRSYSYMDLNNTLGKDDLSLAEERYLEGHPRKRIRLE